MFCGTSERSCCPQQEFAPTKPAAPLTIPSAATAAPTLLLLCFQTSQLITTIENTQTKLTVCGYALNLHNSFGTFLG